MKKFKARKRFNNLIIYIGIFLISIAFSIRYLYQKNMINDDTIVEWLVNDSIGNYKNNIMDTSFLLKYALDLDLIKNDEVFKEDDEKNINIEENNKVIEPIIYLYNTHQDEKYKSTYLNSYNISSTVLLASKILKEYLEKLGYGVIVEETKITEKLHSLGYSYGKSYKVSRMLLEDAKKKNPTLKYFIDIHRDSSIYERTTTDIDSQKYARLLFVIGLENPNYEKNLSMAENLKERINNYNSSLCRGIMKKSGKGVNGIYNQDFDENTILIEVGGQYNNISEVNNTLKVLANILNDYIKEDING